MAGEKVSSFQQRFSELVNSDSRSRSSISSDLGVAKQTISAWITGQTSPRLPMCGTIAQYFGVSVSWLLGYDVPKQSVDHSYERYESLLLETLNKQKAVGPLDDDECGLVLSYRSLSPRGKELLHERSEELKLLYGKKPEDSSAESV